MSLLALVLVAIAVIFITHWLYRWRNPRCNGKLPPGSMGWPLLGETLQFFKPNTTFDVSPFLKQRMKRYGPVFKTSLVGKPIIVTSDPELSHFVFLQEGQTFQCWYPDTFTEILGQDYVGTIHGFMYKYLKNMVLSLFGLESLKKLLPELEETVLKRLNQWSKLDTVEIQDATASMIFNLTAKKLISYDAENSSENLRQNFVAFIKGLMSFPFDIPGTAYHRCLQGRKKAMKMLKSMLQERRVMPRKENTDFFDYVLAELGKEGTILTEGMALDLVFLLLFASFETTSLALTVAIKYLSENPLVLQKLTEEHEGILKSRKNPDCGLTWEDYKSMTFTFQFINETLRLANIAPVLFRKTLRDVSFKGYTIPAGWGVMVCPQAIHLDPTTYENPLDFNPWRWEGGETNGGSKHFMAFGGGMRLCVGAEFSKVQMAVFIHHLVTKYRWNLIRGGNIQRIPGLQFPDGLHIRLAERKPTEREPVK